MRRLSFGWTLPAIGFLAAVLSGCAGSDPSRFYALSAIDDPEVVRTEPCPTETYLGVGPVTLADYLDRPQIVVRAGRNEIGFREFDRWASPLRSDFARVFMENMGILLSQDCVSVISWRRAIPRQYRLSLDVMRFELVAEKGVVLKAQWVLYDQGGKTILLSEETRVIRTVQGSGTGAHVAALSQALADLTSDIAGKIRPILTKPGRS